MHTLVSLIYPSHSSWIALCLIPPHGQRPEHRFLTVDNLSRFLPFARYRNAQGWGIYITPSVLKPNPRHRRKESFLNTQTIIYLDCDQPQCLDRIRQRYPYPTLVVRTSRGRYQVYWRLDEPVTIAQQERLMSAMAVDVEADRAATDVSRVLRLPGFWNRKPGRNNTVDLVFTRDQAIAYPSLWESRQSRLRDSLPRTTSKAPSDAPPVLGRSKESDRAATGGLSQSERDWSQVHRRLALGQPSADIVNWLQAKRIDKPDPHYYAHLTVTKALQARTPRPLDTDQSPSSCEPTPSPATQQNP